MLDFSFYKIPFVVSNVVFWVSFEEPSKTFANQQSTQTNKTKWVYDIYQHRNWPNIHCSLTSFKQQQQQQQQKQQNIIHHIYIYIILYYIYYIYIIIILIPTHFLFFVYSFLKKKDIWQLLLNWREKKRNRSWHSLYILFFVVVQNQLFKRRRTPILSVPKLSLLLFVQIKIAK